MGKIESVSAAAMLSGPFMSLSSASSTKDGWAHVAGVELAEIGSEMADDVFGAEAVADCSEFLYRHLESVVFQIMIPMSYIGKLCWGDKHVMLTLTPISFILIMQASTMGSTLGGVWARFLGWLSPANHF